MNRGEEEEEEGDFRLQTREDEKHWWCWAK